MWCLNKENGREEQYVRGRTKANDSEGRTTRVKEKEWIGKRGVMNLWRRVRKEKKRKRKDWKMR